MTVAMIYPKMEFKNKHVWFYMKNSLARLKNIFSIFSLCGLLIFDLQHGWPFFQREVTIGWVGTMNINACMLDNFSYFCCLLTFLKLNLNFQKFFHKHYQSVKQFGSRSGRTFCQPWSGSKLFAKVISRRQKLQLAKKELRAVRTYFLTVLEIYPHTTADMENKWHPWVWPSRD